MIVCVRFPCYLYYYYIHISGSFCSQHNWSNEYKFVSCFEPSAHSIFQLQTSLILISKHKAASGWSHRVIRKHESRILNRRSGKGLECTTELRSASHFRHLQSFGLKKFLSLGSWPKALLYMFYYSIYSAKTLAEALHIEMVITKSMGKNCTTKEIFCASTWDSIQEDFF